MSNVVAANPQRKIFLGFLIVGSILCIGIYGILFDSMSEGVMMNVAFLWVFFLVTGISGLMMKNRPKPLGRALLWGFLAMLLLFIFFATVWDSL